MSTPRERRPVSPALFPRAISPPGPVLEFPPRSPAKPSPQFSYFKAGITLLVGSYGIACALHPKDFHLLDYVNLVFHEAGHPLFGVFGEFLGALGGSLMQVLAPLGAAGHFFLRGQRWPGTVVLCWVGQSLVNVSVYVKDARARALPLLGDDPSAHDWGFILGGLGLREWDQAIGALVYALGLLALGVSILGGLYYARKGPGADE